jgi:hypothetical protein
MSMTKLTDCQTTEEIIDAVLDAVLDAEQKALYETEQSIDTARAALRYAKTFGPHSTEAHTVKAGLDALNQIYNELTRA